MPHASEPERREARRHLARRASRGARSRFFSSARPLARTSGHRAVPPPARRSGRSRSRRCHAAPSRSGRGSRRASNTQRLRRARPGRARRRSARRGARAAARRAPRAASRCCRRRSRPRRRTAVSGRPARRRARRPRCRSRRRGSAGRSRATPKPGLDRRVRLERLAVLDRVAARRRASSSGHELACSEPEQLAQLAQLVLAARGDQQPRLGHRRTVASTSAWAANSRASPSSARSSIDVAARPVERPALGRALELDVRAGVGADDVEVDLGARVLAVVEVEIARRRRRCRPTRPRPSRSAGAPCRT